MNNKLISIKNNNIYKVIISINKKIYKKTIK